MKSTITTAKGADFVNIKECISTSTLNLGDGDNLISIGEDGFSMNKSSLTMGSGNDRVSIKGVLEGNSQIHLGGGSDSLVIGGDVKTNSYGEKNIIDLGSGDDCATIRHIYTKTTLRGGLGADNILIQHGAYNSDVAIDLGGAEDTSTNRLVIGECANTPKECWAQVTGSGGADYVSIADQLICSSADKTNISLGGEAWN